MIHGMLRIKNEARWIGEVVAALWPACDRIVVLDDHSTDATPWICQGLGCDVYSSEFTGLDEARDKNHLLAIIRETAAPGDWVICIDGDELLSQPDVAVLRSEMASGAGALSLRVLYLWNSRDVVRVDGVYGRFRRPSAFRIGDSGDEFQSTHYGNGANLHCSSVPWIAAQSAVPSEVRLWHLGYMDRADRLRKYGWYNAIDPENDFEDRYRHCVQGDLVEVPAGARLRHAGPLMLVPSGVAR
jgi:glycosyltransferase involved in cell wall biosynthesis